MSYKTITESDKQKIYSNYKFFIIDLWGVVHDGQNLYPEAKETIDYLHHTGKKIIFLSNAPRRSLKAKMVLDNLGIDNNLYLDIITSGEVFFETITKYPEKLPFTIGKNYYYIGPEKDRDIIAGSGYNEVDDPKMADFTIATGFENFQSKIEDLMPQIKLARENNLPMICPNPDLIVVNIKGEKYLCAGVIADEYKKIGGIVKYFGKPYLDVYDKAVKIFTKANGLPVNKKDILAIGDGINTDILGAKNFGIDSVLITSGILSHHSQDMEELLKQYDVKPDYIQTSL